METWAEGALKSISDLTRIEIWRMEEMGYNRKETEELTSGYFAQILKIASRTSIWDSVNPEVSIMRAHDVTEKARWDKCDLNVRSSTREDDVRRNLEGKDMVWM